MRKLISMTLCCLIICTAAINCGAQPGKPGYKILRKIKVEGDGGWDYLTVDTLYNRLFVSHGTVVQVVDINSGKLLETIPDTRGVHGIAIAYNLNKGFISCGKDTSVTVIELKSLKTLKVIKVTGKNPDAILYDNFTKRVFTFNGRSSNVTVIDATSDKVIETISLNGKPEFAVSDDKGKIFANIEDKSELVEINAVTMKVTRSWLLAPGEEPSGLAIDVKNQKLFSVCDNKLMTVSDIASGKVIAKVPIGESVDGDAFDEATGTVLSSNGDGTMTLIKEEIPGKYTVSATVETQKGARTIALNPKTHLVYLPTAEFGETPAATEKNQHPRPSVKPGTFVILELGK